MGSDHPDKKAQDRVGPSGDAHDQWETVRARFDGLPNGGLNIAHECVDRHASSARGKHIAVRWLDDAGQRHDYSYADLAAWSGRFANTLSGLGCTKGTRVFALLPRVPELYFTVLGTLKYGSVFCPLFAAFGPEPIQSRMSIGEAEVLVTTAALYERKVAQIRDRLPSLKHVLLVDVPDSLPTHCLDFHRLLDEASSECEVAQTRPDDLALLHFTSGTTGKPKGVMHVHEVLLAQDESARYALDLRQSDVFWCTADPGWVTGLAYGLIAPLSVGATLISDAKEFDPLRWYHILQHERVNVWYTAPTAVRMLMKYGSELAGQYQLEHLRFMASVGEPLNPEAVLWGQKVFGKPFHDNWWQTETGAIMIANHAGMEVKPGSMGKPLPGIEVALMQRNDDGAASCLPAGAGEGELAIKAGWPSMFRGYLNNNDRYQQSFAGDWYLSGDLARRDADGYYWFVGRVDDLIKSSGHLIGPFEVESALMEHPAVAEAGVIGKPDVVAGALVKAFVALKPGYDADDTLRRQLISHARKKLGAAVAPREIEFQQNLPKTRSGKIMRRLLKARELGLPEGDVSTLENSMGNTDDR